MLSQGRRRLAEAGRDAMRSSYAEFVAQAPEYEAWIILGQLEQ
jgi:hypothetical protein